MINELVTENAQIIKEISDTSLTRINVESEVIESEEVIKAEIDPLFEFFMIDESYFTDQPPQSNSGKGDNNDESQSNNEQSENNQNENGEEKENKDSQGDSSSNFNNNGSNSSDNDNSQCNQTEPLSEYTGDASFVEDSEESESAKNELEAEGGSIRSISKYDLNEQESSFIKVQKKDRSLVN